MWVSGFFDIFQFRFFHQRGMANESPKGQSWHGKTVRYSISEKRLALTNSKIYIGKMVSFILRICISLIDKMLIESYGSHENVKVAKMNNVFFPILCKILYFFLFLYIFSFSCCWKCSLVCWVYAIEQILFAIRRSHCTLHHGQATLASWTKKNCSIYF